MERYVADFRKAFERRAAEIGGANPIGFAEGVMEIPSVRDFVAAYNVPPDTMLGAAIDMAHVFSCNEDKLTAWSEGYEGEYLEHPAIDEMCERFAAALRHSVGLMLYAIYT